jgi:hypothetical protein
MTAAVADGLPKAGLVPGRDHEGAHRGRAGSRGGARRGVPVEAGHWHPPRGGVAGRFTAAGPDERSELLLGIFVDGLAQRAAR